MEGGPSIPCWRSGILERNETARSDVDWQGLPEANNEDEIPMLYALAVILLILWLLGFVAFHVGGGLIHLLLVVAVIVVIYQLVTSRRAL
jgi:hypothetical protein